MTDFTRKNENAPFYTLASLAACRPDSATMADLLFLALVYQKNLIKNSKKLLHRGPIKISECDTPTIFQLFQDLRLGHQVPSSCLWGTLQCFEYSNAPFNTVDSNAINNWQVISVHDCYKWVMSELKVLGANFLKFTIHEHNDGRVIKHSF